MHTIVIVSESDDADEGLKKQLEMLFPECRIKVISKKMSGMPPSPGGWYPTGKSLGTKN